MTPEITYQFVKEQPQAVARPVVVDRDERAGIYVNAHIPTSPAGTPMHELQESEPELYSHMMERVTEGIRYFDGYPYPGKILSAEVYDAEKDPLGNEHWYGVIYLKGQHFENEVGEQVPREKAWNGTEDETRGFVEVSTNIWEPGRVFARLIPYGKNDYQVESDRYREMKQSGKKPKHLQHIEKVLLEIKKNSGEEESFPMAAD